MLRPDDTLQFFTSPYRRTRETTEGILKSLTASDPEHGPSPFPRHTIKVFEEPRIREQDFGNFQPCSAEMERMWQERADYGHFFYRIPNGESAADAYDRISGFNESLWRNFSEDDFPSVCVLVTHGLMTRVFLMKWYHWSVEYFEDLRNVNHCEFVVMRQHSNNGKYILENQLRTWSELKRKAAATTAANNNNSNPASSTLHPLSTSSPSIPPRKWGGCVGGCNHNHSKYPRRNRRGTLQELALPPAGEQVPQAEKEDHPVATQEIDSAVHTTNTTSPASSKQIEMHTPPQHAETTARGTNQDHQRNEAANRLQIPLRSSISQHNIISPFGRDFGGSMSGAATPSEGLSDIDSDGGHSVSSYFPSSSSTANMTINPSGFQGTKNASHANGRGSMSGSGNGDEADEVKPLQITNNKVKTPRRRPTPMDFEEWARQSGMGAGARAERLGDEEANEDDDDTDDDDNDDRDKDEGVGHENVHEGSHKSPQEVADEEEMDRSITGSVY